MLAVGIVGQMVFYLQAFEIFTEKSSNNVSLGAFLFGLFSVTNWLIYGIVIKNRVLYISNTFAVIGAAAVVFGILFYRTSS
jgi:MtN3 and saliva related transmembrane protein